VLLEVVVITAVVDAATEVIGAELVVAVPAGTVMVTLPLRQNFSANCMVACWSVALQAPWMQVSTPLRKVVAVQIQ